MDLNIAHPPIREALIDVRFNFGVAQPDYHIFEKLHEKIKADYPKKQVLKWGQLSMNMQAEGEPIVKTTGGEHGYRFDSADGTKIVQFRTDGFTFSKLKPYTGWADFSAEAKKLLDLYLEATNPVSASRIALRYINLIEVPESAFKLDKYFTVSPIIPEGMPQTVIGYVNRVVLKDDSGALGVLTQTIDPQQVVPIGTTPYIFDVDVYFENVAIDPKTDAFWEKFKPLRELKNKMFSFGLTDVTKKLFE